MAIKLRKTEDERNFERRSRISKWKSDIDRALRQYKRNYDKNVESIKEAISTNNLARARLFATNIITLEGAMRGLTDYKLFLDNVDLSLQFAKTTKDIWASLSESTKDLTNSQLTEKQALQVQQNVEKIISASEQIEDRLTGQLDMISSSIDQKGLNNTNVEDIVKKFSQSEIKTDKVEESRLDDIIKDVKKSIESKEKV
jgi:hypothetical protein